MIGISVYGCGNLFSLGNSMKRLGLRFCFIEDKKQTYACSKIILPGVGAFGPAMEKLRVRGMDEQIKILAADGMPILGICLGMQLLFEKSFENGIYSGLGLLKGEIKPLKDDVGGLVIPHMGWNTLKFINKRGVFKYNEDGDSVYFVHSYHAKCCDDSLAAVTDYGTEITAAVNSGCIYGVQFHPEKSGETGLKILKAFSEL